MSRPRRYLIAIGIALLALAAEVGINAIRAPVACVKVVNEGPEPIEDLRIICGTRRASVATIAGGETARVYIAGRGRNALKLEYRQRGNALTNFEIGDFNPAMLSHEGSTLVLNIQINQYERFQEQNEPSMVGRWWRDLMDYVERSLTSP